METNKNNLNMNVNVKKLREDAVLPFYAHEGDAGLDLTAVSKSYDEEGNVVYGTGIAVEIPAGHVGLLFPRSSNSKKHLFLTNHVGVIDSTYTGEIFMKFRATIVKLPWYNYLFEILGIKKRLKYVHGNEYEVYDRIGQLIIIPIPKIEVNQVRRLKRTNRGANGYGSTGK